MNRQIGLSDISAAKQVARRAAEVSADVVHGHGAKGGAYARLVTSGRAIRAYTPHGGSLHFSWSSLAGFSYLASERFLARRTELFLFESEYGRSVFERKLGRPRPLVRVVHNGIGPEEFAAIAPQPGATDLVFLGELRMLKGVDVLIEAIAALRRRGKGITATIVGEGPERQAFGADGRGARTRARDPLRRGEAGTYRLRARPHPRRALAGRIASLCGARSRRSSSSHDFHRRRGHFGNLRSRCRVSHPRRRCRSLGKRHRKYALRPRDGPCCRAALASAGSHAFQRGCDDTSGACGLRGGHGRAVTRLTDRPLYLRAPKHFLKVFLYLVHS